MQTIPEKELNRTWKVMIGVFVIFAVIVIAIFSYYFFYLKRTPEYSIKLVKNAINTHDIAEFQRHVDLDSLLAKAYDDLVEAAINKEDNAAASGFAKLLKQPLINAMKDEMIRYIETGDFGVLKKPKQQGDNRDMIRLSPRDLDEKTGFSSSEFRGIAYTRQEGEIAAVGINIWEKQVAQEYILDLKMRELEDGTWQIVGFNNLNNYITCINKAKIEKLAEINRPIEAQITNALTTGNKITAMVVPKDSWGISYQLEVTFPVIFHSEKSITEITGILKVSKEDKLLMEEDFSASGSSYKGKTAVISYFWDLNPIIPEQKTIIETPKKKLNLSISVRSIKFSNGKQLRLLDKLPES